LITNLTSEGQNHKAHEGHEEGRHCPAREAPMIAFACSVAFAVEPFSPAQAKKKAAPFR
jgi:hypothetical protein